MILILTQPFDPTRRSMVEMLGARGAEFVRFDPADFPSQASLSIGYSPDGQMRSFLRVEEKVIDLTNFRQYGAAGLSRPCRISKFKTQPRGNSLPKIVRLSCPRPVERCPVPLASRPPGGDPACSTQGFASAVGC